MLGILYELCTLNHPFNARNQGALILKIIKGDFAPLDASRASPPLVAMIHRLLSRDADRRPSARQVLCQPIVQQYVAACGLVLPLIFTPMELVKVRRQVMRDDAATSWELARAAWREGGVAALYTGHRFTVARSTLGNASLFGAFEAWKALLRSPFWPGGDVGAWRASVLAGVLSGWTTQLVTFPLDAAKSRAQVAGAVGGSGMLAALASLFREGAAYRGVSLNLIRAVPVHLAYLPVYGVIMTALTGASV